jgi:hypothetical protein
VITIVNYDAYQQNGAQTELQTERRRSADDTQQIRNKKKQEKDVALELFARLSWPKALDNPEGRAALREWYDHKATNGHRYKATNGLQKILNEFASHPPQVLQRAVDVSIQNNWAGVFLDQGLKGKGKQGQLSWDDPDLREAYTG